MAHPHLVCAQAARIRLIASQSMKIGDALLELGLGDVAAELCDVELTLFKLHEQLLELATQGSATPRLPQLSLDGDVPF